MATGGGAAATGRATGTDYPGEARAFWRLDATRTRGGDDSDSQTRRAVTLMLPAIFRRRSNCARATPRPEDAREGERLVGRHGHTVVSLYMRLLVDGAGGEALAGRLVTTKRGLAPLPREATRFGSSS